MTICTIDQAVYIAPALLRVFASNHFLSKYTVLDMIRTTTL